MNCATNVYDIASNADAFTRVLDLVVVTTLVSQVWIDDDRAGRSLATAAKCWSGPCTTAGWRPGRWPPRCCGPSSWT